MPKKIEKNFLFVRQWYLIWLREILGIKQIMLVIGNQHVKKQS